MNKLIYRSCLLLFLCLPAASSFTFAEGPRIDSARPSARLILGDSVQTAICHYLNSAAQVMEPKKESFFQSLARNGKALLALLVAGISFAMGIPGLVGVAKNRFQPAPEKTSVVPQYFRTGALIVFICAVAYFASSIATAVILAVLGGVALLLLFLFLGLQYWKFLDPQGSLVGKNKLKLIELYPKPKTPEVQEKETERLAGILGRIETRGAIAIVYICYNELSNLPRFIIECEDETTRTTIQDMLRLYTPPPH